MQLSEEHLLIREMALKFAAEELMPTAGGRDKSAAFPASELKDMGALGLMGMLTPEKWGGSEVGHVGCAIVLEEIAAGDGAISTIASVHNGVGQVPIVDYGTTEQKERFLGPLA
ncbi:MAG: acyl-CoA dehydrogenase family protein, partial [Rhodospirillales bacterium]